LNYGTNNTAVRFGCDKIAVVLGPEKITSEFASPQGARSAFGKHEAPSTSTPNQLAFPVTLVTLLNEDSNRARYFAGVFLDQVAIVLNHVCVLFISAV
jgi:hypothetical protein